MNFNSKNIPQVDVNNKIIKHLKYELEPIITHLINRIIITEIFPYIYKLSRMLPLLKPDKSYRPINNLCAIEKIIEQYFQDYMIEFMELHSIMSTDHHGGKKLHSTQTAMTQIYNKLYNNKEENLISLLLCTDLSAAYDTVEHDILLKIRPLWFQRKNK